MPIIVFIVPTTRTPCRQRGGPDTDIAGFRHGQTRETLIAKSPRHEIGATTTKTGLKVECALGERTTKKGIRITKAQMKRLHIEGDAFHPEWNYTIKPRQIGKP